jgi:hypothetical protein
MWLESEANKSIFGCSTSSTSQSSQVSSDKPFSRLAYTKPKGHAPYSSEIMVKGTGTVAPIQPLQQ